MSNFQINSSVPLASNNHAKNLDNEQAIGNNITTKKANKVTNHALIGDESSQKPLIGAIPAFYSPAITQTKNLDVSGLIKRVEDKISNNSQTDELSAIANASRISNNDTDEVTAITTLLLYRNIQELTSVVDEDMADAEAKAINFTALIQNVEDSIGIEIPASIKKSSTYNLGEYNGNNNSMVRVLLFLLNIIFRQLQSVQAQQKVQLDLTAINMQILGENASTTIKLAEDEFSKKMAAAKKGIYAAAVNMGLGLAGGLVTMGMTIKERSFNKYEARQNEVAKYDKEVAKNVALNAQISDDSQNIIKNMPIDTSRTLNIKNHKYYTYDKDNYTSLVDLRAQQVKLDNYTKAYRPTVTATSQKLANPEDINLTGASSIKSKFLTNRPENIRTFVQKQTALEHQMDVSLVNKNNGKLRCEYIKHFSKLDIPNKQAQQKVIDLADGKDIFNPVGVTTGTTGFSPIALKKLSNEGKPNLFNVEKDGGNTITTFIKPKIDASGNHLAGEYELGQITTNSRGVSKYDIYQIDNANKSIVGEVYNTLSQDKIYALKNAEAIQNIASAANEGLKDINGIKVDNDSVNTLNAVCTEAVYVKKFADAEKNNFDKYAELRKNHEAGNSDLANAVKMSRQKFVEYQSYATAFTNLITPSMQLVNGLTTSFADQDKAEADFIAARRAVFQQLSSAGIDLTNTTIRQISDNINQMLSGILESLKSTLQVANQAISS